MIELLNKSHIRNNFDCGKEQLNNYVKFQVNQDIKRKLSACFVLSDKESNDIKGFYTLSNYSIPLDSFPDYIQNKFPKSYQAIPCTLLGRLAINLTYQGQGIGKILLIDALKRSYEVSKEIGSFAVVVDPIDDESEKFYEKFGFIKVGQIETTIKDRYLPIMELKI